MKKILILSLLALFGLANMAFSQGGTPQSLDSVYVAGAEKTVLPIYSYSYDGMKHFEGAVAGFVFDVTNYVDTLTVLIFEGGYKGTDNVIRYTPIDTLTELSSSKPYKFYQTPPVFQYYRMRAPLVSGDTATLKNIIYFEKFKLK